MSLRSILAPRTAHQQIAIALLRIVTGIVFAMHGYQKVFTYGLAGITAGFTQMGTPAPELFAPLVSFGELLGGIALIFGFLTRFAAVGLILIMAGAIMLVHLKEGFFAPKGFEFPLTLLTINLALALAGPGALSVDGALFGRGDDGARDTRV